MRKASRSPRNCWTCRRRSSCRRRAGGEARGHARLRGRGRALRTLRRESRGDPQGRWRKNVGRRSCRPTTIRTIAAGQGTSALEFSKMRARSSTLVPAGGGGTALRQCAVAATASRPASRSGASRRRPATTAAVARRGNASRSTCPRPSPTDCRRSRRARSRFRSSGTRARASSRSATTNSRSDAALLFERMKLVVEPSGAAAFAAVLNERFPVRGKRVGIVLSGGNVDAARYAALLSG